MHKEKNPRLLGTAGFVLFMVLGSALGLPAQQKLPPSITVLFPANVKNVTGNFNSCPAPGCKLSGGDIYGEIPNTRDCSRSNPQTGVMHIRLLIWRGEAAAFMADRLGKGIPDTISQDRQGWQRAIDIWAASNDRNMVDQWGPIHEEAVPGGTAIWYEKGGPCIMDENPRYNYVSLTAYSMQGFVHAKVEIGFQGEIAAAKAMLIETLEKIAKTDFSKIPKGDDLESQLKKLYPKH